MPICPVQNVLKWDFFYPKTETSDLHHISQTCRYPFLKSQPIRALPKRQRAVVVLHFWDDLSVHNTVAALDISEGTVKSHTARGLAALSLSLSLSLKRTPT